MSLKYMETWNKMHTTTNTVSIKLENIIELQWTTLKIEKALPTHLIISSPQQISQKLFDQSVSMFND